MIERSTTLNAPFALAIYCYCSGENHLQPGGSGKKIIIIIIIDFFILHHSTSLILHIILPDHSHKQNNEGNR